MKDLLGVRSWPSFLLYKPLVLCLSLILPGCSVAVEPPAPTIFRAAGPEATLITTQQLADAFTPDLKFNLEIENVNSGRALDRLLAGEIDFVLLAVDQPEAWPELKQLQQTPIARDGLAIIVHPDNPVTNLTLRDLEQLYSGRIFNWRDVQGSGDWRDLGDLNNLQQEIQTVTREDEAGIREVFQTRIFPDFIKPTLRMTPNARIFANDRAIVDFVSQHPEAIGYVSAALLAAEAEAARAEKVKIVAVEEVLPNPETLTNTAYPLTYLLYIVTPSEPKPRLAQFVDFILGPVGQSIIKRNGFGRIR